MLNRKSAKSSLSIYAILPVAEPEAFRSPANFHYAKIFSYKITEFYMDIKKIPF
jgi:hypothetical protein